MEFKPTFKSLVSIDVSYLYCLRTTILYIKSITSKSLNRILCCKCNAHRTEIVTLLMTFDSAISGTVLYKPLLSPRYQGNCNYILPICLLEWCLVLNYLCFKLCTNMRFSWSDVTFLKYFWRLAFRTYSFTDSFQQAEVLQISLTTDKSFIYTYTCLYLLFPYIDPGSFWTIDPVPRS